MTHFPVQVAAWLEELSSRLKVVDWVSFNPGAPTCTVGFEDGSAVLLEWDDEQERLMALALLGRPPEHAALAVYRTVLAYNGMWRENAGARIVAVDAEGELALMFELAVQALTLERLRLMLESVRSAASAWGRYVADPADEHDGPPVAPLHAQRV